MKTYKVKIDINGTERWYNDQDQYHCEHGPAIIFANGSKQWFINSKLHNEHGPAIIFANGTKYWYINGNLHNENGPAASYSDGTKRWYLNGIEYTESEWKAQLTPTKELTLAEVINELGYNVKIIK